MSNLAIRSEYHFLSEGVTYERGDTMEHITTQIVPLEAPTLESKYSSLKLKN